jgi:adenosylmethionine-8-amino-7-oxononanoate aminotransferase
VSIKKVGHRSPRVIDGGFCLVEGPGGIPGSGTSPLFYQDWNRLPTVSHGKGVYLYDTEGREYLDGCSGAIAANLGHGHERLVEAATEQMRKVAFAYRQQFENQPANELAELLVQLSPPELNRVFFVNSGSEAVESAIKLARQHWWGIGKQGKSTILSRRPCYHGSTLGALATTDYAPLNTPFRPLTINAPKVAAAFCYHCPLGKEYPTCGIDCAWDLDRTIQVYGAENIAAFVTESIGGASTGAAVPPDEYFPLVERICNENEILLIIDDVMAGCGRTGTFYGYEHWDITPDIVAVSKGLSGGYTPIGAIIASDTIVDPVLENGGFRHGHTYAGNPLSAAIALEATKMIIDEGYLENARLVGTYLHEQLHGLKERHAVIGDVRGRGLLAAVELVRDRQARDPFPANWFVGLEVAEIARSEGVLIYPRRPIYGLYGDHFLVAPPLIVTREEVDELIRRLDRTLEKLSNILAEHVAEEVPVAVDDGTVPRYEQSDEVPEYARGDLSEVDRAEDANVTAAMEPSAWDSDDLTGPIEEEDSEEPV